LCWACFYKPEVRALYPSTSKFARHGLGTGQFIPTLPAFPTNATPGSPEKIAILQQRALSRQELFHPHDASFGCPARTAALAG